MTLYGLILTIHIIGAVVGLGAAFALPIVMKLPKTVSQAKFSIQINHGIEKMAKFGSISLLITGLIMGALNTALFTSGWFITSIILYIAVQPIVAAILPKMIKQQAEILENEKSETLPEEYLQIAKKSAPYNTFTHVATIVLIILMTVKPF